MKKETNNELLDDVLAEAAPADFREALLGETLRVVRRRRRVRQTRSAIVTMVALALLGFFALRKNAPVPSALLTLPSAKTTTSHPYTVVNTRPLSANAMVTTRPMGTVTVITSETTVAVIETTNGNFRTIGDEELLALVAAHPAILVQTGPQSEKLVFANPADAKGFPEN
jgi:hypothetical protein